VDSLTGFLGPAYLWVKAAHVTFVIFWMAGLFMLPRLYVYHQESAPGSAEERQWIEREARVRSIILTPAMVITWALGLILALHLAAFGQTWFTAKLALVVVLTGYQGWLGSYGKKLAAGNRTLSGKALRLINEFPGIAAALIVVLVIVRPF
jgi:putative membrane protein